jgi:hypothetical protein
VLKEINDLADLKKVLPLFEKLLALLLKLEDLLLLELVDL